VSEAEEVKARLSDIGNLPDDEVPLIEVAILLSRLRHPGRSDDRYVQHIRRMGEDVAARHRDLIAAGAAGDIPTRIAALKHILVDQNGYGAVEDGYEKTENADLMSVVDNRRGLPIMLSILAIESGRAQGWNIEGINFPGHFLVRMDGGGERVIFDPFHGFRILQAPDMRDLLKKTIGPGAELSAKMYESASNREMLLRLQNNIKLRQIEAEDYQGALETVETMRLFAPGDTRLLLDAGVLYSRTGQRQAAVNVLEQYVRDVSDPKARYDAEVLLRYLQDSLN
jgi:regulator of sirC expression with transglutaminase-like and TPR domain